MLGLHWFEERKQLREAEEALRQAKEDLEKAQREVEEARLDAAQAKADLATATKPKTGGLVGWWNEEIEPKKPRWTYLVGPLLSTFAPVVAFLGVGAALWYNFVQIETIREKADVDEVHFKIEQSEREFKNVQDRLASSDEKTRAAAALQLAELATTPTPQHKGNDVLLVDMVNKLASANRDVRKSFITAMAEWSETETNPEAKKGAGGELTDSQITFLEMVTQFCEKSEDARLALQVLLGDGREKNSEGKVVKLPLFRQERIVCAGIRAKEEGKVRLVANAQALPDLRVAVGRLNDAREMLATGLKALSEPADLPMKDLDALEIVKHEVETVSTSSVREKDLGRLQTSAIRLADWKRTASIDLSSCFLTDVDLNGVTLPGVQLSGATLIGAKLREANLTGAHFDGANLTDAYLYEAKLAGTDLQGATLTRTNLVGAALTRAYLRDAELSQVNLFRATLTGAEISGATLTDANMPEAILIGAELRMATLTRAVLSEAKLTGAKMYGATLAEAKLDSAILTEARLDTATLKGADLDQATLTGANVGDSDLDKARNIPETWRAADYHDSLGRENNDLRKRVQKAYEGQNHLGQ